MSSLLYSPVLSHMACVVAAPGAGARIEARCVIELITGGAYPETGRNDGPQPLKNCLFERIIAYLKAIVGVPNDAGTAINTGTGEGPALLRVSGDRANVVLKFADPLKPDWVGCVRSSIRVKPEAKKHAESTSRNELLTDPPERPGRRVIRIKKMNEITKGVILIRQFWHKTILATKGFKVKYIMATIGNFFCRRALMSSITRKPVRQLLDLKEGASRMGISVWTLRHWIAAGKFPSFKLRGKRLVDEAEVEDEIRRSRQEVTAA